MDDLALFAVNFRLALARLEAKRARAITQRWMTNLTVGVATAFLIVVGLPYLSFDHAALGFIVVLAFWILTDRINKLHVKHLEDQIHLLILVDNSEREPDSSPSAAHALPRSGSHLQEPNLQSA